MRVDGIDVEFELELENATLVQKLRIDGETTDHIGAYKKQKLLFDFESQTLLVIGKRPEERFLIPASAVLGMKLISPPKEEPAPVADTGEADPFKEVGTAQPVELGQAELAAVGLKATVTDDGGIDFTPLDEEPPAETQAKKPKAKAAKKSKGKRG